MPTSRHLERLNDQRWLQRRVDLLMVRGNTCEGCCIEGSTVHVHHGCYIADRYPWDYPDESLHIYCPTCHGKAQALMTRLNAASGALGLGRYRELVKVAEALLMDQDRERAKRGEGRGVLVMRK